MSTWLGCCPQFFNQTLIQVLLWRDFVGWLTSTVSCCSVKDIILHHLGGPDPKRWKVWRAKLKLLWDRMNSTCELQHPPTLWGSPVCPSWWIRDLPLHLKWASPPKDVNQFPATHCLIWLNFLIQFCFSGARLNNSPSPVAGTLLYRNNKCLLKCLSEIHTE